MKYYETTATYGSSKTPCTLLVAEKHNGSWYAVEGSQNVNFTSEEITEGCDIEELSDTDAFTWPSGVNNLDELEAAIEA